jgi:hypothetical protein
MKNGTFERDKEDEKSMLEREGWEEEGKQGKFFF